MPWVAEENEAVNDIAAAGCERRGGARCWEEIARDWATQRKEAVTGDGGERANKQYLEDSMLVGWRRVQKFYGG